MTFTYTGVLDTDLEKVRLEIGDTNSSDPLFSDEEINHKLVESSNDTIACASSLCFILATRFSREVSFSMDGQRVDLSDKAKMFLEMGQKLLARSSSGVVSQPVTVVDGYAPIDDEPDMFERTTSVRGDFETGGRWT